MKILRREPKCADLVLEISQGNDKPDQQLELTKAECTRVLRKLIASTKKAVKEIFRSKLRRVREKKNRISMPEHLDDDEMLMTRDRIELEKSELSLILEQLDTFWKNIPQKLRSFYQEKVDKWRETIKQQIGSNEGVKTNEAEKHI